MARRWKRDETHALAVMVTEAGGIARWRCLSPVSDGEPCASRGYTTRAYVGEDMAAKAKRNWRAHARRAHGTSRAARP